MGIANRNADAKRRRKGKITIVNASKRVKKGKPKNYLPDDEVKAVDRPGETSWKDDSSGKLESKLAEIVARIIVAGEAHFRRGLKEAEERAEQFRRWEEERRQKEIEARNAERLKRLRESGDLLRQAEDLRALIARVRGAVVAGSAGVDQARLEAWERWATAEADRLDPILSEQIMTHLAASEEQGGSGESNPA